MKRGDVVLVRAPVGPEVRAWVALVLDTEGVAILFLHDALQLPTGTIVGGPINLLRDDDGCWRDAVELCPLAIRPEPRY